MIKFMTWYFPIKILITLLFLVTNSYHGTLFLWFVFFDLIFIPIVVTIGNLIKRKKLRSGEYKIKPEGRRL